MPEGKPVCPVGEEWGADAVVEQGLMNAVDPENDACWKNGMRCEEGGEPGGFVLEREGEPGQWLPIGEAVGTVRSGALRAVVVMDADAADG